MPDPYYSYLVVASPWQASDSGIASIVPLAQSDVVSNSNLAPVNRNHVEMAGGEKAAYDKAVKALKAASPHSGLSRSEEHTSELQSLMRNSYAVFCLKKKKHRKQ